jgi:DNA-binding PadR family transcriptional regulator
MDKLILGLLMLRRFTVYEIRGIIQHNFKSLCSDSLGSIQAAIKRLLTEGLVTYSEYVERSVNKKQYSITDKGRDIFSAWLNTPADLTISKNMELGKLFYMGIVPKEKRIALLDEIIARMQNELSDLNGLKASIDLSKAASQVIAYFENDAEYLNGIHEVTQNFNIHACVNDIGEFQMYKLQYSIDFMKFQIDWFNALKAKLTGE